MFLIDTFEHTLDDRGRVAVPARYRPMFAEGVFLVRGSERCIELYTPQDFWERSAPILRESADTESGRRRKRKLFSHCRQEVLDGQGRVLIPARLRQWAGLDSTVIIVGRGDCLELWSPQRWGEEEEEETTEERGEVPKNDPEDLE
jgi:MraZ protein